MTITHGQGTITIDAEPERVVGLGAADTQIATALGAEVVGAVKNSSSEDGNWPGVEPKLPGEVTVLDAVTPNLEQIAALEPDLILATAVQPEYVEAYDELSDIAPVVSYLSAPLQDSGEELVELIGDALGVPDVAAALVAESDRAIQTFRDTHPQLAGHEYVFGQYAGGVTYLVAGADTQSVRFMERLGLTVPDEIAALTSSDDSYGMITPSPEELEILDSADVALISETGGDGDDGFISQPLAESLQLQSDERLHIISVDLAIALLQPNPAITTFLLAELEPYAADFDAS